MRQEHSATQRGAITRLQAQGTFGCIVRPWIGAAEITFHARDLDDASFAQLRVGQPVEFDVVSTPTGLRAVRVRVLGK